MYQFNEIFFLFDSLDSDFGQPNFEFSALKTRVPTAQVSFFPAKNHNAGFFRGPWTFLFSEKKPTKFGFFGRFLGIDRKLLKFYLHKTNFNLFFIHFKLFLTTKIIKKKKIVLFEKNMRNFLSAEVRSVKNLLIKMQ